MAQVVLRSLEELHAHAGRELGISGWHQVTQSDVAAFAEVTGDHQWIHVDAERAEDGPFGGTIVHGYFTLSLAPRLLAEVYALEGVGFALNYGLDRVRFPAPMAVGGRLRLRVVLAEVAEAPDGVQVLLRNTFEREGGDKPVCVADSLTRIRVP